MWIRYWLYPGSIGNDQTGKPVRSPFQSELNTAWAASRVNWFKISPPPTCPKTFHKETGHRGAGCALLSKEERVGSVSYSRGKVTCQSTQKCGRPTGLATSGHGSKDQNGSPLWFPLRKHGGKKWRVPASCTLHATFTLGERGCYAVFGRNRCLFFCYR